ncbi:MAG: hypothetical protein R6U63_01165 [Longimicrobiales bacterium]
MPEKTIRKVRTKKGVREYYWVGCPLTKNRAAWCFRLCDPDADGKGQCGRLAPHGLKSRTQRAIAEHNRQRRAAHLVALENDYLAGAEIEGHEPGVRLSEGEAEVVLELERGRLGGALSPPVAMRTLYDAAWLAVASVVETEVAPKTFEVKLTGTGGRGVLIARGLFVGMAGDDYLVEVILTDADARDLGRAEGVFAVT